MPGLPQGHTEAGHDLIENQDTLVLIAESAQPLQKSRDRGHTVHIARYWLNDNAGDLLAHLGKYLLDLLKVVVFQCQGISGHRGRDPGRCRHAQSEGTGAGLDQQGIGMAVVTALEFDR